MNKFVTVNKSRTVTAHGIFNRNMKRITEGKIYTGNGVSHRVITLNQVADRILELCNGKNRVADIAKIIQEEYDSSYDVYRDISDTISMFLAEEIVYLSV